MTHIVNIVTHRNCCTCEPAATRIYNKSVFATTEITIILRFNYQAARGASDAIVYLPN